MTSVTPNLRHTSSTCAAVSELAKCSLKEDKFGVVQKASCLSVSEIGHECVSTLTISGSL